MGREEKMNYVELGEELNLIVGLGIRFCARGNNMGQLHLSSGSWASSSSDGCSFTPPKWASQPRGQFTPPVPPAPLCFWWADVRRTDNYLASILWEKWEAEPHP